MKKVVTILSTILLITMSYGQVEQEEFTKKQKSNDEIVTLLGKSNAIGGFGGVSVLYSQIDDKDAFVFGARGGVILGHVFAMGFGGAGFINDYHIDEVYGKVSLAGGYGGIFFEPIILPRFPVHLSIPVLVGAGGVAYTSIDESRWDNEPYVEDSEAFLVIEPGLELEMNITKFFRFSFGGYYRYTSDIELLNTPKDVLNGFSAGVNFKFGKF